MKRLLLASGYFILLGSQSLYCRDNGKGAQITSVKIGEQVWSADNLR